MPFSQAEFQAALHEKVRQAVRLTLITILDEEGIQLLMLDAHSQSNLVGAVDASHAWCEQYRDDLAVLFTRSSKTAHCPTQLN